MGNLKSVSKALEAVGAKVKVTDRPEDITAAAAVVLPGVGAFQRAMDNLTERDIIPALQKAIAAGKPFLGICLGLQILFTESEEYGVSRGLDIIPGKVKRFTTGMKIPHMGWNSIKLKMQKAKGEIFAAIPDESYFYFVHSYYVKPKDESVIAATTEYNGGFTAAVNKDNIWGVQFHPEKSAAWGLKLLGNFCRDVS